MRELLPVSQSAASCGWVVERLPVSQVEVWRLVVVVEGAAGHAARGAVVEVVVLEAVVGQVVLQVVLGGGGQLGVGGACQVRG